MKTTKIYDDEKEVYCGNCYVNTVIFRGRIYGDFQKAGQNGIKFSLQLSNGKDEKTGEWNKPTFADCTAFGKVSKEVLKGYKPKDKIWLIVKYYSKQIDVSIQECLLHCCVLILNQLLIIMLCYLMHCRFFILVVSIIVKYIRTRSQ